MTEPDSSRRAVGAWVWVVVVLGISLGPLGWNLAEVRRGTPHFPLYVAALLLLVVATAVYLWLRERFPGIRRREPVGAVVLLLAPFVWREPAATLLALWVAALSFAVGARLLGALGVLLESVWERLVLWTAAGLGVLSGSMFVLGLVGLYRRPLVYILLGVATVLLRGTARTLAGDLRRARTLAAESATLAGPLMGLCVVFGVVAAGLGALVVLAPETSHDPIATHLHEARYYAETGAFRPPPEVDYHYYPKNVEMIQTLGFLLHSQAAAQMLGYLYTPLAVGAVFLLARWWFSSRAAVLAAALTWTTPLVVLDGSVAKNDLGLALYLVSGVYAFLRWKQDGTPGWARVMAVFLGLSFGVKHTALLVALPLALLIAVTLWRQNRSWGRRLSRGLVLLGLAVAAGGFWHLRTYVLTGNPLYPLGAYSTISPRFRKGPAHYARTAYEILYRPRYRLPEARSPHVLGFAVVALLPLVFVAARPRCRAAGALWFLVGASALLWVRWAENLRFLIPTWMIVHVLLAGRAETFWDRSGRVARAACLTAAGYCFFFALQVSALLVVHVPRLQYAGRLLDREQYLHRILAVYPALAWLNHAAREGERVYAVGTCARLYSRLPLACYVPRPQDFSPEEITAQTAGGRYRYLLYPAAEAGRLPSGLRRRQVYQDDSYLLFRMP